MLLLFVQIFTWRVAFCKCTRPCHCVDGIQHSCSVADVCEICCYAPQSLPAQAAAPVATMLLNSILKCCRVCVMHGYVLNLLIMTVAVCTLAGCQVLNLKTKSWRMEMIMM